MEKRIREIFQEEFKKSQQANFSSNRTIPIVEGSQSSGAALASLLLGLKNAGIVVNKSTT